MAFRKGPENVLGSGQNLPLESLEAFRLGRRARGAFRRCMGFSVAGEDMTEEDELTIQRFAAIERGAAKGIDRFRDIQEHLWCEIATPHLDTMQQLARGERVPHENACRAVAKELTEIEAGKKPLTLSEIPRFLRRARATP